MLVVRVCVCDTIRMLKNFFYAEFVHVFFRLNRIWYSTSYGRRVIFMESYDNIDKMVIDNIDRSLLGGNVFDKPFSPLFEGNMFIYGETRILLGSDAIRLASIGMINVTRGDKVKQRKKKYLSIVRTIEGSRIINHPFTSSLFCVSPTLPFFSHWCRELMVENQSKTVRCHDNGAVFLINLAQRSSQLLLFFFFFLARVRE